jgi:biotin synthase
MPRGRTQPKGVSTSLDTNGIVRTDWTREEIAALFDLPFDELVYQAATVHRAHHAVGQIQLCTCCSVSRPGVARRIAAIAASR